MTTNSLFKKRIPVFNANLNILYNGIKMASLKVFVPLRNNLK